MTIGPTTPARFSALELNASIVPRSRSEWPATMACMAGTPNQVPAAQRPSASRDSTSDEVVSGIRSIAVPNSVIAPRTAVRGPSTAIERPESREAATPTRPTIRSASPAWADGTACVTWMNSAM